MLSWELQPIGAVAPCMQADLTEMNAVETDSSWRRQYARAIWPTGANSYIVSRDSSFLYSFVLVSFRNLGAPCHDEGRILWGCR